MLIDNIIGQIIVTRHVESKKEKGKTDFTKGITPEGYSMAKNLGQYLAENYITRDMKVTAVSSGMDRSRQSLEGITDGLGVKVAAQNRLELSAVESEVPKVVVDGKQLSYGGKDDKIAYIAREHKEERTVEAYNSNVQNVGNGYFAFLYNSIREMQDNDCFIISGHGPSERSHLIQLADNLANRETADRIYNFLIENGGTKNGKVSCSYLITRDDKLYLVLGDKESEPIEIGSEIVRDIANKYDYKTHEENIEQSEMEVY